MEAIEAIKTRRSIRRFKATPVEDKIIELVLDAARWAPSWKNSQCWRFIVVKDIGIKNKLADTLIAGSTVGTTNPSDGAVRNAPVVIVACAELGKSGYSGGKLATDKGEWWYMFDVALATENLMLAAHSLGLGTVAAGLFDAKRAADILEVPQGFCVVLMLPLGYPAKEPRPIPKKELSEIVFYDRYGFK
ncbi:5,6-dimethylbenzimidazole synthase [subsurface metagenome]